MRAVTGGVILLFGLWSPSYAQQSTMGAILATVTDDTGAVLPGVSVSAINTDTGVVRTGVSNEAGLIRLTQLLPGHYQLKAELEGFRAFEQRGITLSVGDELNFNLRLLVGSLNETVTVTAAAPLVETTKSEVSGLVSREQTAELPLSGRSYDQLALLQPGVAGIPARREQALSSLGRGMSVAGTRPNQSTFIMDGADVRTISNTGSPASVTGEALGMEAIREFRVITSNFSAEYGNVSGGVVTAVTKSGANQPHGSAFLYYRDDSLNAPNFFDVLGKPDFTRKQFGGSLGGRIVRDRTFFFTTYEGLRQKDGRTFYGRTLTAGAREGRLPNPATGAITQVTVSPLIKPFLGLWPEPNGRDFGDGTAEYAASFAQPTTDNYASVRVDHTFSNNSSIFGRYSRDVSERTRASNPFLNWSETGKTKQNLASVEYSYIFTSSLLNTVRVAMNQFDVLGVDVPLLGFQPNPALRFATDRDKFGSWIIPGLNSPGPTATVTPFANNQNVLQVMNDVTYTRQRHALKFGFSGRWDKLKFDSPTRYGGEYRFASLTTFLQARPNRLQFPAPGADFVRNLRDSLWGFYVQDQFRVSQRLTLNAGVRYEFITEVSEKDGKVANIRHMGRPEPVTVGMPFFKNPSLKNVAPRVGFAWDASGNGRVAVRGGVGLFHDEITMEVYRFPITRLPPFFSSANLNNPPFPNALEALASVPASAQTPTGDSITFEPRQPYYMRGNVQTEWEFVPGWSTTAGYIYGRGRNLLLVLDSNTALPSGTLPDGRPYFAPGLPRQNPLFAGIRHKDTVGNSFYHGLVLALNKRFGGGYLLQTSYTISRSVDDNSTPVGVADLDFASEGTIQNPFNLTGDRGFSNFDVRHNFVTSFVWRLPWASGLTGPSRFVLDGWQVSGIMRVGSGVHFTPQIDGDRARSRARDADTRPDWAAGRSPDDAILGTPDRWFDPTAFVPQPLGTYGLVGRNVLQGPGMATLDFSLIKNTRLRPGSEGGNVQLRIETFNLLNRANFTTPAHVVFDEAGNSIGAAGRITNTSTEGRQIQLALRFDW